MTGIMSRPAYICRRFVASTCGVAAIEFAMIMPVLLILLLASFDGGRAIVIYMKVRSATYTLAAITNQYKTPIQSSDMQTIVGATSKVLAPYPSAPAVVTISQIVINAKGQATVSWSYSTGGSGRAQGSSITIPANIAPPNVISYLIFSEVSYNYTPLFGYFGSGAIALSDNLYVTPRSNACIQYAPRKCHLLLRSSRVFEGLGTGRISLNGAECEDHAEGAAALRECGRWAVTLQNGAVRTTKSLPPWTQPSRCFQFCSNQSLFAFPGCGAAHLARLRLRGAVLR